MTRSRLNQNVRRFTTGNTRISCHGRQGDFATVTHGEPAFNVLVDGRDQFPPDTRLEAVALLLRPQLKIILHATIVVVDRAA